MLLHSSFRYFDIENNLETVSV